MKGQTVKPSKRFVPIPPGVEIIGKKVLDAAYTVHSDLGPGLLESVYEACLAFELRKQGLNIETQAVVPVKYQDIYVETGLRLDLWVEKGHCRIESSRDHVPTLRSTAFNIFKSNKLSLGLFDKFQRQAA